MMTMLKRVVHPGDILKDELEERGVLPASFARQIDVSAQSHQPDSVRQACGYW